MPELTTTLTVSLQSVNQRLLHLLTTQQWALPVRVEQLGAHLEAYIATLPTIATLRLCNRFGTGNDCHIKRLPVELVKLIEEYVVEPEREKAFSTWSQQHKCYEEQCTVYDHYSETREELHQRYHELIEPCECGEDGECGLDHHEACGHRLCAGTVPPGPLFGGRLAWWKVLRKLQEFDDLPSSENLCVTRTQEWRRKIGMLKEDVGGFFEKQQRLLETHFGIIVWLGHTSIPDDDFETYGTYLPVTTAHLALPGSSTRREQWCADERAWFKSFDMPLKIGSPLTSHSLSRFPRALKVLGLQAGLHASQSVGTALTPPPVDDAVSRITEDGVPQPQLTLLVRSTAGCVHGRNYETYHP